MRILLNMPEACVLLGCSTSSLGRWMAAGCGPRVTRIGRRVYFGKADLNAWIRANRE